MIHRRLTQWAALAALGACTAVPASQPPQQTAGATPPRTSDPTRSAAPTAPPAPLPPATFAYAGKLTQGGWLRGLAPAGTISLTFDSEPVPLSGDGNFLLAFDRDSGSTGTLVAQRSDGSTAREVLTISPRDWRIERIDIARQTGGPSESFMRIRRPELAKIDAARARETAATGWRQDFAWPVKGRVSGVFGSQRIYRGEPGSYHSGIDIAPGAGVPFAAPADGVVVLAEPDFSLEGKLLIIDHGMGLNSAFLHAQRLDVGVGDRVRQGQQVGLIGSSGRATGPHLHWSLKWRDARLDPLLFTGPMDD